MHIEPFVCSNVDEFIDERQLLRNDIFPYLKAKLESASSEVTFDPIQLDYTESNSYFKSGHLLRLLLTNIEKSHPIFIGLVGFKYGLSHSVSQTINLTSHSAMMMTPLEKNLLIASQTGYSNIVNVHTYENSFLEHQINLACSIAAGDTSFFRFYFRQYEYLEHKFEHLSLEERRNEINSMEAEDEWAKTKLEKLKAFLVKKGIQIRYYKSLEQFKQLVFEDFDEILYEYSKKSNPSIMNELVRQKLKLYVKTNRIDELVERVDAFLTYTNHKVHFKLDDAKEADECSQIERSTATESLEDYSEIMRLKYSNITSKSRTISSKRCRILLITGERGSGKTSLMAFLHEKYNSRLKEPKRNTPIESAETALFYTEKTKSPEPYFLFYFLKSSDYLINMIVDITYKMRLKYLKKDSSSNLDEDLSDPFSLIEQFHAALNLGPLYLFVDGLCNIETTRSIAFDSWFPTKVAAYSKFVFTARSSHEICDKLADKKFKKFVSLVEMCTFGGGIDADYHHFFGSLYRADAATTDNCLYAKYLNHLDELKTSRHRSSPLFMTLMAHEIFTLDKEIHLNHPVYQYSDDVAVSEKSASIPENKSSAQSFDISLSQSNYQPKSLISSYVDEVATIREVIEKMLKRYIKTRSNWSTNFKTHLSLTNPGWFGDVFGLLALSYNGLKKSQILRILDHRGYKDKLKITDLDWAIFRMLLGDLVVDDRYGSLQFCHDYFKEAVQTTLFGGFNVKLDVKFGSYLDAPTFKINEYQKNLCYALVFDLLRNRLNKYEFELATQIDDTKSHYARLNWTRRLNETKYLKLIHDLIGQLYMSGDLINLCKFLTNFKVLHLYRKNRQEFPCEWFELVEMLRSTTNPSILGSILVSSLTIGIGFSDDLIRLNISNSMLNSQIEHETSKQQNLVAHNENTAEHQQKPNYIEDGANSYEPSVRFGGHRVYEELIDDLLDLNDTDDDESAATMTSSQRVSCRDTLNMALIVRSNILVDLLAHLHDHQFSHEYLLDICIRVSNIVFNNFRLDDIEKYNFSKLLANIANMAATKANNYKTGLKYMLKSAEILKDLYDMVYLRKSRNRVQMFQLGNKLSYLYSQAAFMLFKLDNPSAAESILVKATRYSRDKSNIDRLVSSEKVLETVSSYELALKERQDTNVLIYRQLIATDTNNKSPTDQEIKVDYATSYETNFALYLVSGLLEVQKGNYSSAKQFFDSALNISLKWYGFNHLNTAQIYQYYGQFLSLDRTEFFDHRRAEFYLRKALHIIQLLKNNNYENKSADILFDLCCLLSTSDSALTRREACDLLRRALDIKMLKYGCEPNAECERIQCLLYELGVVDAMKNKVLPPRQPNGESFLELLDKRVSESRLSSSSSTRTLSSRRRREKAASARVNSALRRLNQADELNRWIDKNSFIEVIPITSIKPSNENTDKSMRKFNFISTPTSSNSMNVEQMRQFQYTPLETASSSASKQDRRLTLSAREKISKRIYYQSAWYDIPPGSSKFRYRNYVKLTPNV